MKIRYLERGYKEIFYFRLAVPTKLRMIYNCRMIRRSLRTTNTREAIIRAQYWLVKYQQEFEQLRLAKMEDWQRMATEMSRSNIIFSGITRTMNDGSVLTAKSIVADARIPEELAYARELAGMGYRPQVEIQEMPVAALTAAESPSIQPVIDKPPLTWIEQQQSKARNPMQPSKIRHEPFTSHTALDNQGSVAGEMSVDSESRAVRRLLKLSELLEEFIKEKQTRGGSARYLVAIEDAVRWLIEYLGDIPVCHVTRQHLRDFVAAFALMPSNRNKKVAYKGKSIRELLAMDIPAEDRIATITFNNNIRKLSTFTIWLNDEELIEFKNPFGKYFKKEKVDREQWDKFSDEEVQKIFDPAKFTFDKNRISRWWIPLLLVHTGARVEEMSGLHEDDIMQDPKTGIWFIRIQKNRPEKFVKTDGSHRDIPVNESLKKLGFLDYVRTVKIGKHLFPDLNFKTDFGYHESISRYFARYLVSLQVINAPGEKKSLKSFRHTVITTLLNKGVSDEIETAIVGHVDGGKQNMSRKRYHKGYDLDPKKAAVDLIDWNFNLPNHWKKPLKMKMNTSSTAPAAEK